MARGEQLGRQWKIIQALIASQSGMTASRISKDLQCARRTVYRDLEALQEAGFPITSEKREGYSYWSVIKAYQGNIPIPLSIMELMALYFSRDMLKILKGTVYYEAIESLFTKIRTTLAPEYIDRLDRIKNSIEVGKGPYKDYEAFGDIISDLNKAVMDQQKVEIAYYTMSRDADTRRVVSPYRLRYSDQSLYLIGYCALRKDIRTFAIDRIRQLKMLDHTFDIPDTVDMDAFSLGSFRVFHGRPVQVKIHFSRPVAGYIREKIWHHTQKLSEQKDGSVIFTATVAGLEEITYWVLRWGASAKVLAPEALALAVKKEAEKMIETYETDE